MIILLILITSSHDNVWMLLGENCCWSLLGLKGLTNAILLFSSFFPVLRDKQFKHTRKEKFNIVFVVAPSFTDHDQNQHYLLLTNLLQIRLCVHVCWMCNMHIFKFTVCINLLYYSFKICS